jgi:hypothetical protein
MGIAPDLGMTIRRVALLGVFVTLLASSSLANPYDDWKTLTSDEKKLALRYFWQLPGVMSAAKFARARSEAQYPTLVGQDDQRDAYRHSMWNGSMTSRLGSREAAARWGFAHEEVPNNPAQRKAMDLENNHRGRELAWAQMSTSGPWWNRKTVKPSDDDVAKLMLDAVEQGKLIMIEEVNGQRDPNNGKHVPTTKP